MEISDRLRGRAPHAGRRLERCLDARVALGAVAPTALRVREAERALEGQPVGAEAFRRAAEAAQQACRPSTT